MQAAIAIETAQGTFPPYTNRGLETGAIIALAILIGSIVAGTIMVIVIVMLQKAKAAKHKAGDSLKAHE